MVFENILLTRTRAKNAIVFNGFVWNYFVREPVFKYVT